MRNATERLLLVLLVSLFALAGLVACSGSSIITPLPDGDQIDTDESEADSADTDTEAADADADGDSDLELSEKEEAEADSADTESDADTGCTYRCLEYGENPIDLGATGIGNPVWRDFVVKSVGQSTVTIFDASLIASSTSTDIKITSYTPHAPVIQLPPQQSLVIRITGNPSDLEADTGKLSVNSDAENGLRKDFDITMSFKGTTTLVVDPLAIDWGPIKADNSPVAKQITFTAQMDGDSNRPLRIVSFAPKAVSGRKASSSVFTLQNDALCTPPYYLNSRQARTCNLFCTLPAEGDFSETWVVEATDNSKPTQLKDVTLTCKGVRSKLVVAPETVSFGYVLIQRGVAQKKLQLRNEGTGPLNILSLTYTTATNTPFGLNDNGALLAPIAAGETKEITVTYTPIAANGDVNHLQITSDDPRPVVSVPVSGFAVANCPPGLAQNDPNDPTCNPSCTPGDTICWPEGGSDFVICGPDGTTVGDVTPCPGYNQVCANGICQDKPCQPNETTCKDDMTMAQCKPDGSGWLPLIPCTTTELCHVSRCFNMACRTEVAPPSTTCEDNNPCTKNDVCDSSGHCKGSSIDLKTDCPQAACKVAGCNATTGCYLTNIPDTPTVTCDDGNACTGTTVSPDVCRGGECKPGTTAQISCDDHNECTVDTCSAGQDGKPVCTYTPVAGGACSNADECTVNSKCAVVGGEGKCVGEPRVCDDGNSCTDDRCVTGQGVERACVVSNKNPGTTCDDGDPCTIGETCGYNTSGIFVCKGGAPKNCDDNNPCTVDSCGAGGTCLHDPIPKEGTSCDADKSPCTVGDKCISGACVAGPQKNCDDQNDCTDDVCNPLTGACLNTPTTIAYKACDDKNPCTLHDTCSGSQCIGQTNTCDDDNDCTNNICDKTLCVGPTCVPSDYCRNDPVLSGTSCNDNSACTTNDVCNAQGVCTGTATTACSPSDVCTTTTCDPLAQPGKQCVYTVLYNKACNDGAKCTTGATCQLDSSTGRGKCQAGTTPVDCGTTGTICKRMSCIEDQGGCVEVNQTNDTPCDDDPCYTGKKCSTGSCVGGALKNIDDGNSCTDDLCTKQAGITHPPKAQGTACDDALKCTTGDTCDSSGHCLGTAVVCAEKPCNTNNGCNAATGTCAYTRFANGTSCEDGNKCTSGDTCQLGDCVSGPSVTCTSPSTCKAASCDPAVGCVLTALNDGTTCDDGSVCTGTSASPDTCSGGICVGGALVNCDDGNVCTDDVCGPTGCTWPNNTAACASDGNECTIDKCRNGECKHDTFEPDGTPCTDDGNSCTNDYCVAGGCVHVNKAAGDSCASDNNPCTKDLCVVTAGVATCMHDTPTCSDGNPCTTDICNPTTGACSYPPEPSTTSCEDGKFCTVNDHCDGNGTCASGPARDCTGTCRVGGTAGCNEASDKCDYSPVDTPCDLGNHNRFGDWCNANGECKKSDVWKFPGDCKPEAPGVGYYAEKPNMARVLNKTICIDKYEMVIRDRSATGEIKGQGSFDYWYCFYGNLVTTYQCDSVLYKEVPKAYSEAGVVPSRWMFWDQADYACRNNGKRLCWSSEWTAACKQASNSTYPYGTDYQATICNGHDYSSSSDSVLSTGSATYCVNNLGDGKVFDLSGNLWEWVKDGSDSSPTRYLRGGAYNSASGNLTCDVVLPHHWKNDVDGTIGARCCDDF